MTDLAKTLALSASGMEAQGRRLRHVTENVANADTPGFRRKLVDFRTSFDGLVAVGPVRLDPRAAERIHDPAHPLADAEGYRNGSNVDLLIELADSREAQRSYEANLRLFDQTRQMAASLIETLRR
jgi:flagellar basal-body rod protein FlgC